MAGTPFPTPLEVAREWLRPCLRGIFLEPDFDYWARVEANLRLMAGESHDSLLEQAPHDPVAWEYARDLARKYLDGHRIPPWRLVDLALRHLAGETAPPPRPRGRYRRWYLGLILRSLEHHLLSSTWWRQEGETITPYRMVARRFDLIDPDPSYYVHDCIAAALSELTGRFWHPDTVTKLIRQAPHQPPARQDTTPRQ